MMYTNKYIKVIIAPLFMYKFWFERRIIMDFIDNWILMDDSCVLGHYTDENNVVSSFRTQPVVDITPLPNGNSLLETKDYYCELGRVKGE